MQFQSTVLSAFAVAVAAMLCCRATGAAPEDGMRQPWQRGNTDYQRRWFTLSPIRCDLHTDCVIGEASMQPADGREQTLPDGSRVTWHAGQSWGDTVNPDPASADGNVAYSGTLIHRDSAAKARITVGSDDGVRVWLNGRLLLARDGRRTLVLDEDVLDVDLAAGDNTLLLKSASNRSFAVRIMAAGAVAPRRDEIAPEVIEMQPEVFTVRTDASAVRAAADPVKVSVIAPGGAVKFNATARRGELVVVDTKGWADGPYDVKATTLDARGLRTTAWRAYYKGNALVKARELARVAAAADGSQPEGFTLRMLAEMVDDRLGVKVADAKGNAWPRIHSPLMEFDELMLERQGKPARVRAGGFVRLAWRDETDGTPQYCRAYLPEDYDAARKWPALLMLHGYNPPNPRYVDWWGADSRHSGPATEFSGHRSLIYIEPHGRGNTQYRNFGDADVLRCLAEAKRAFAVDENRVYLSGESMGGWGTWNVATRHPDLFAAIAPVFGGADFHSQSSDEALAAMSPVEKFLQERESSWAFAESLNNIPIFIHHGDVDQSVNVEWTRWGLRMLQRWGYDVRYHEYPGRGHEVLGTNNALMSAEFFLSHVRDPNPRHVRIHTAELRNARAYWVDIDAREHPLDFMSVDAEVVDRNVIRLDTQNVASLSLAPAALVDATQPVKVVWNGVEYSRKLENGKLRFASCDCKPGTPRKSPALPGGLNDFFNTPFAVVVGTSAGDARARDAIRRAAEAFGFGWEQWQKYRPRVFLDTEIADADIAKYSLLLVGGANANRVTAKLAGHLPLKVTNDSVTIGGRKFAAHDAGVQMLYPNPRNPSRYVWLVDSTSPAAMDFAAPNATHVDEWDFIVVDGHAPPPHQTLAPNRTNLVSGSFDEQWRFDAKYAFPGDVVAREQGRVFALPDGHKADAKLLASVAGRYRILNNPVIEVKAREGRLFAQAANDPAEWELEPVAGHTFYVRGYHLWVTFTAAPQDGGVTGFTGYNGDDFEAQRIP